MIQVSQDPYQLLSLACAKMTGYGDGARSLAIQANFSPVFPVAVPNPVKIYPVSLNWSGAYGNFSTILASSIPYVFSDSIGYAHTILIGEFQMYATSGGGSVGFVGLNYVSSGMTPVTTVVGGLLGYANPFKSLGPLLATETSDGGLGGTATFDFSGLIIRLRD